MSVKLALEKQPCLSIISAYVTQTDAAVCEEAFWDDLHVLQNILQEETVHHGRDLNGHVATNTYEERCHARRKHLGYYRDCKVIPGEPLTIQHSAKVTTRSYDEACPRTEYGAALAWKTTLQLADDGLKRP
ncbi:hypothetical protein EVAR_19183_1 [Eumeta japonica]|uniref:Uncharacterized protein n=1 Tax=Eumeta variegata TaxID=151549 RepID=A0A4C1VQB2_EUMVA|nr:hypothetical protein EVAR_19183_1 [Eumeta japonica]